VQRNKHCVLYGRMLRCTPMWFLDKYQLFVFIVFEMYRISQKFNNFFTKNMAMPKYYIVIFSSPFENLNKFLFFINL